MFPPNSYRTATIHASSLLVGDHILVPSTQEYSRVDTVSYGRAGSVWVGHGTCRALVLGRNTAVTILVPTS